MSLLNVERAIRTRFKIPDALHRSKSGLGLLIPEFRGGVNIGSNQAAWANRFTGGKRLVPVYRWTEINKPWEAVLPSVVYRRIRFEYDETRSVSTENSAQFKVGTAGDPVTLLDRAGRIVGTGTTENVMGRVPPAYNHYYQFDIWATHLERELIIEAMKALFPDRGFLPYFQNDGSLVTVFMVDEETVDLDEPVGELGEDRKVAHTVMRYRVEAFADYSTQLTNVSTVLDAEIETVRSTDPEEEGLSVRITKILP